MGFYVSEWHIRSDSWINLPISVPLIAAKRSCWAAHSEGWTCSRREGHGGRHAAYLSHSGEVVAVWR